MSKEMSESEWIALKQLYEAEAEQPLPPDDAERLIDRRLADRADDGVVISDSGRRMVQARFGISPAQEPHGAHLPPTVTGRDTRG